MSLCTDDEHVANLGYSNIPVELITVDNNLSSYHNNNNINKHSQKGWTFDAR